MTEIISTSIKSVEWALHIHLLAGLLSYLIVYAWQWPHLRHLRMHLLSRKGIPFEKMDCPLVTVIVPAYNEADHISHTIDALRLSRYPNLRVLVINDGSSDTTIPRLKKTYGLKPTELVRSGNLSQAHVHESYQAALVENLFVIDKEHSGKADSLNLAIDFCCSEYVFIIDADSIVESHAINSLITAFINEPRLVALGGTVFPSNHVRTVNGRLEPDTAKASLIEAIQVVEYLRSFMTWRVGWSYLNGLYLISGAMTAFRTQALRNVSGFRKDAMCEDFEIIMSIHQYYLSHGIDYRVWSIPDVVCWTRVPKTIEHLGRQRVRWMAGGLQTLKWHWRLILNRKNPILGFLALPHLLFIEILGPIIEFIGVVTLLLGFFFDLFSIKAFLVYAFLIFAINGIYTWYSLYVNDRYLSAYSSLRQIFRIGIMGLFEPLGYRQRDAFWRLQAIWWVVTGRRLGW